MGKINKFILALNNNGIKDFQNYQLMSAQPDGRLIIKNINTKEESIIHVEAKLEREIIKLSNEIKDPIISEVVTKLESVIEESKNNTDVKIHEDIISIEEEIITLEEEKISEEKIENKKKLSKKIEEPLIVEDIVPDIDPKILEAQMEKIKKENEKQLGKKINAFKKDLLIPDSGKKENIDEIDMEFIKD